MKGKTAKSLSTQVSRVDWQSERLSPEQGRFLNWLFSRFAELLAPRLTPALQLRAFVALEETTQEPFKEFLDHHRGPAPLAVFDFNDKTKGLMAFDWPISFSMLDYLLGGKGEALDESREFSSLEKTIFRNHVANTFLSTLGEAWKDILPAPPTFDSLEFSPNSLVAFSYGEFILSAKFSLRVGIMSGSFRLVVPLHALRELMPKSAEKFMTQTLTKSVETLTSSAPMMGKRLEKTSLSVAVELGEADVFFQDLLHLEIGDIVRLETRRGSPLKIKVAGRTKFLGKPGTSEKKMAIRITELAEEGENTDE